MKLGLILNEPAALYHSQDAISSSRLADMRIAGALCPLNYYVRHVIKTVLKKDADHFRIGTAAHLSILEGSQAFADGVTTCPPSYTSQKGEVKPWHNGAEACKEWRAENSSKLILNADEVLLINAMSWAIISHPEARALTACGQAEVTFRKQFGALTLQCRADKWHADSGTIVDLKTCKSIEAFEKDFYFLRYNFRAAFYQLVIAEVLAEIAGVHASEIETPAFKFVAVEKSPPHRVKVYVPDAESLEAGRREVHADLITLRSCLASGVWPTGCEGEHSIGLKTWQLAKSYDASDAVLAE